MGRAKIHRAVVHGMKIGIVYTFPQAWMVISTKALVVLSFDCATLSQPMRIQSRMWLSLPKTPKIKLTDVVAWTALGAALQHGAEAMQTSTKAQAASSFTCASPAKVITKSLR